MIDMDIDPHTPGMGSIAASTIDACCATCSSPGWWSKGCRFYTLSKGRCWFKQTNYSVVPSPGKISGQAIKQAPAPPPPPPWPKHGPVGDWTKVGPWGIGDDFQGKGEAGTLADAVSPAGNPKVIYTGGRNNGASSGLLKSIDGGDHWVMKSNGIFDTRIVALGIVDMDKGDHVYVSVPGKVYETTDAGESWNISVGSEKLGTCYTFKNGTINGEPHILASCDTGIGNIPSSGGEWNIIPPGGWGRGGYLTVSDAGNGKLLDNSVVGGCLGGHVFVGTIINNTAADWSTVNGTDKPCVMLALNPNDKDHFIYTHPPMTYQSMDGGLTHESLNHSNIFHCGIDRQGALYTAAMGGAFVSHDCGPGPNMKRPCSWQAYYDNRTARRTGQVRVRGAHDYQRINLDFGGSVGFVSDQGLFVVDYDNSSELELISANGNLSNNIALKAAISKGGGTKETRSIVTAIWDWAPLASWDNGAHWPSWQTPEDGAGASCIGEGGGAYAMGASNHMLVMHHHNIMHSAVGGQNMTRMITPHAGTIFGATYQFAKGSRSEPSGFVMAPLFINVAWNTHIGQVLDPSVCQNATDISNNLTQHTNYSCLSAIDFGYVYGTHSADYATWDGSKCITCIVPGNQSDWKWTPKTGSIGYSRMVRESERSYRKMMKYDMNGDGVLDESDMAASLIKKQKKDRDDDRSDDDDDHSDDDRSDDDDDRSDDGSDNESEEEGEDFTLEVEDYEVSRKKLAGRTVPLRGGGVYILKSFNFGAGTSNWTYTLLPPHIGVPSFVTDPTNDTVIYTVNAGCIAASYDTGDTWSQCWNLPPPPPSVDGAGFHKSDGDLPAGHDINVSNMTELAAETWCNAQANCSGFTAHSAGGDSVVKKIWFKQNLFRPASGDPTWVTYIKAATPGPAPAPPPTGHAGLVGSFGDLAIKNSTHMIITRSNDVPLRTSDGGTTWMPMESCRLVANFRYGMGYSWSAETLVMMGSGGTQTGDHPHAPFVWVSKDDGETWVDETGGLVTMGPGEANWYEKDFYINSMGEGIMSKTLE